MEKLNKIIEHFETVAKLAGVKVPIDSITPERLASPHKPPKPLPAGKMAVYVFIWGDYCLKVGKVGPKSNARYTSQHYNPKSSKSNLAKSILRNKVEFGKLDLNEQTVGEWIKSNVDRWNFILDESLGVPVLSLMEAFLQCKLRPKFEGFDSQK